MKWICLTHSGYVPGYKLTRDLGAMCLGLQAIGEDAGYYMMDSGKALVDAHIKIAKKSELEDPEWWKWTGADIVLMMAAAAGLESVSHAIKKSGVRLALRMDSDGYLSPSSGLVRFARGKTTYYIDQMRAKSGKAFPLSGEVLGASHALVSWLNQRAFDSRFARRLNHADFLLVESPKAGDRLRTYLNRISGPSLAAKVQFVPAAVLVRPLDHIPPKHRQILSVGMWWRHQKDFARLIRVLGDVLDREEDWEAIIVGEGSNSGLAKISQMPPKVAARFRIHGAMPHDTIEEFYRAAKIHFLASRGEGFPNVASEAACWGCSNVGWREISAFHFLESVECGTAAANRSIAGFREALIGEIHAWSLKKRDPAIIAGRARAFFSKESVAYKLKSLFIS